MEKFNRIHLQEQFRALARLMKKIILWAVIFWLMLWVYSAVGDKRYASRIYVERQNQYDVVAVGDSLVEGLGSDDLLGFVGRLHLATGINIYNAGHRRDQTKDIIERLDRDVLVLNPKIVIVVIGGNDAVRFVPEEQVLANMEVIFRTLREKNIEVIFGEVTDNVLFSKRNQALRALGEKYQIHYIQGLMEGVFWTLSKKFDPLHPDDAGYQMMTDRILPVLRNVLEAQGLAPVIEVQ